MRPRENIITRDRLHQFADPLDTHLRAVIHLSAPVPSAVLVREEIHRISGRDILLAFVV